MRLRYQDESSSYRILIAAVVSLLCYCVFKLSSHFGFQGVPHHQLPPQYQKIVERLKAVEQEISGGAMAIVAVVLNNKLYIANVGELVFVSSSV